MIILRWILIMSNVSDKSCRENQNTHFLFNKFFFRKSCRLWDNVEKCDTAGQATDDNIIRRMRFACRITKARIQTDTHNTYLIFIIVNSSTKYIVTLQQCKGNPLFFFPWQHWTLILLTATCKSITIRKGKCCCVSMGRVITRTRHYVKLDYIV